MVIILMTSNVMPLLINTEKDSGEFVVSEMDYVPNRNFGLYYLNNFKVGYIILSDNIDANLIYSHTGTEFVHPNSQLSITYSQYSWNNTRFISYEGDAWELKEGINYGKIDVGDYRLSVYDSRLSNSLITADYTGALFETKYYENCIAGNSCDQSEIVLLTSIDNSAYKLYVSQDFIYEHLPI